MDRLIFNPGYLYTRREVMQLMKISIFTLKRLIKDGAIKPTYIGKRQRFLGEQLQNYLEKSQPC